MKKEQQRQFPAPQGAPMIPEFDYRLYRITNEEFDQKAKEISEALSAASLEGWQVHNFQEAFFDGHVVFSAMLVRGKEKRVLGPVGLA